MDRDAIKAWLRAPGTTWRWSADGQEGYDAVELRERRLRWYRWSHAFEGGGAHDEILQPADAFLNDGPPRDVPQRVQEALRQALAATVFE